MQVAPTVPQHKHVNRSQTVQDFNKNLEAVEHLFLFSARFTRTVIEWILIRIEYWWLSAELWLVILPQWVREAPLLRGLCNLHCHKRQGISAQKVPLASIAANLVSWHSKLWGNEITSHSQLLNTSKYMSSSFFDSNAWTDVCNSRCSRLSSSRSILSDYIRLVSQVWPHEALLHFAHGGPAIRWVQTEVWQEICRFDGKPDGASDGIRSPVTQSACAA